MASSGAARGTVAESGPATAVRVPEPSLRGLLGDARLLDGAGPAAKPSHRPPTPLRFRAFAPQSKEGGRMMCEIISVFVEHTR